MDGNSEHHRHVEEAVYVYEAPVRIWHWVNAAAIAVLAVTGYLIGSPPPTVSGEAYDNFLMGTIRWLHFSAGYILIAAFVLRLYWAFVGNRHAREIFLPPVWRASFWKELLHEAKWYLMLVPAPKRYAGHNPLAILVMHFAFVWPLVFMILTGLALYGEGTGMGSWQYEWFSSWIIPLFGQSQDVHTWHHLGMWAILVFVMVHVYAAVREDIMSLQSIISSMISGWRTFRPHSKAGERDRA